MTKEMLDYEERKRRRPPLTINEKGEVVFADGFKIRKDPIAHKPTPLMLCNEVAKIFGAFLRENTREECSLQGSYREILFHLARKDGRTQLELANLVHITPPTASVALQKLEDEGYILRRSDKDDKRKTRVYLTEKGKNFDEKSKSIIRGLNNLATKGFTEEEINTLCVLLYRVRENIAND